MVRQKLIGVEVRDSEGKALQRIDSSPHPESEDRFGNMHCDVDVNRAKYLAMSHPPIADHASFRCEESVYGSQVRFRNLLSYFSFLDAWIRYLPWSTRCRIHAHASPASLFLL
jgi:hypothetical protein